MYQIKNWQMYQFKKLVHSHARETMCAKIFGTHMGSFRLLTHSRDAHRKFF